MAVSLSGISVRGLAVADGKRQVLDDVSFTVAPGTMAAVLGEAGSGKTTLLAAIGGLIEPQGTVLLGGTPLGRRARREAAAFLPPGLLLGRGRLADALRAAGAPGGLAGLGLETLAGAKTPTLSHGQGHAAMAAARLQNAAGIVLVDEAGTGLDAPTEARLLAAMRAVARAGGTVLFATRIPELALGADQIVLLHEGRVIQTGTPASTYAEPRCAVAARLTGRVNVIEGVLREVRPGGFRWSAGGARFLHSDDSAGRPALGAPLTIGLRPERLRLLAADEAEDNAIEGEVLEVRAAGPSLLVSVATPVGVMLAAVPSFQPAIYPRAGLPMRLAWAAMAGVVLEGRPGALPLDPVKGHAL